MQRREFLLLSSALALPFSLAGCIVPAAARREEDQPIGGSWADNARQAQAIFAAATSGRFTDDYGVPLTAVQQRSAWLAARGRFQSLPSPLYSDAYGLARAGASYFAALNTAMAASTRRGGSGKASYRENGQIVVQPGDMVVFNERGYCMDPTLPAPGRGELLRLVPTTSLVPPDLQDAYQGLLKQAARNDRVGAEYRANMQNLVWMFRTAGQDSPYLAYPSRKAKQLIEDAHPGGWGMLERYHRRHLASAKLKADIYNALARGLNLPANARPADFADHNRANRIVDEQVQTLINTPVGGQIVPGSQYTLLAPGVAAEVVGSGPLAATFRVVNTSGEPFRFSPAEWSAESQRKSQRVAFPGNVEGLQRSPVQTAPDPNWWNRFSSQAQNDFAKMGAEKLLAYAPSIIGSSLGKGLAKGALKTFIDTTPLVGNALAIYESVSGKNWMTGEALDSIDHALAVLGTIPGASVAARLGGGARGAVRGVLDAASATSALKAVDRGAIAADVVNIGNMESTKILVEQNAGDRTFQSVVQSAERYLRV